MTDKQDNILHTNGVSASGSESVMSGAGYEQTALMPDGTLQSDSMMRNDAAESDRAIVSETTGIIDSTEAPVEPESQFDPEALVFTEYQCPECEQMAVTLPEFPLRGCMFCSASYEEIEPTNTLLWAPDSIVPFNVDKGLFFETALRWMSADELIPDDIFRQVYLDLVEELYLPFFLYAGSYTAEFSASVGTEQMNEETKETSINWQRVSGNLDGDLALLQYAATGALPEEMIRFMEGMTIHERAIRPFSEFTIEGSVFRPFDVDAEVLYEYKTASDLQQWIEQQVREQLDNPHIDQLNVTPKITYTMRSVYLPFWLLNYQYKGETYYTIVDGFMLPKKKKPRVFGTRPKDEYRELLLDTLYFPFKVSVGVAALITLVLLLLAMDMSGWWHFVIVLGFIVYVLAMLKRTERRRFDLIKESKEKKNLALRHLQQNALDILTTNWRAELFAEADAKRNQKTE